MDGAHSILMNLEVKIGVVKCAKKLLNLNASSQDGGMERLCVLLAPHFLPEARFQSPYPEIVPKQAVTASNFSSKHICFPKTSNQDG